MKCDLKIISVFLIILIAFSSIPVAAGSGADDSSKTYIKIGIGVTLVIGAVAAIRAVVKNNKAGRLYHQGTAHGAEGHWDLAVQSYMEAMEINPKYKDVAGKLEHAKREAVKMFICLGDEARAAEKYEVAEEYYQQALKYVPDSTLAQSKLNDLSEDLMVVYYRRGLSYENMNRWSEAYGEYKNAFSLNPDYLDISERYQVARARLEGNLPLRAILFFINNTSVQGIENLLVRELQTKMVAGASGKYVMLDHVKVQGIIKEQAAALSSSYNESLAIDIGRLLGADEVIIGELKSVEVKSRVKMEVSAKILTVSKGEIGKEVKPFSYTFPKGVTLSNLLPEIPGLAEELAKRLNK
jgi:tetratricopeptide (TPR) repeat protein